MAQGIRAGIEGVSFVGGNIAGKDVAKDGDAWTAAKCILRCYHYLLSASN